MRASVLLLVAALVDVGPTKLATNLLLQRLTGTMSPHLTPSAHAGRVWTEDVLTVTGRVHTTLATFARRERGHLGPPPLEVTP
jgi:hypothetical protein